MIQKFIHILCVSFNYILRLNISENIWKRGTADLRELLSEVDHPDRKSQTLIFDKGRETHLKFGMLSTWDTNYFFNNIWL